MSTASRYSGLSSTNLTKAHEFVIALLLFAVAFGITPAWAAPLFDTPVYDPSSKSYFELVDASHMVKGYGSNEGPSWAQADAMARQRAYKGVQGRLAIIRSIETHFFLERTFQPNYNAWIGLRLWCTRRVLEWSDGAILKPGSFQAWDKKWNQDVYTCSGASASPSGMTVYAPIAYTSIADGFRWIAKGSGKRFYYFFVQYPTGHP